MGEKEKMFNKSYCIVMLVTILILIVSGFSSVVAIKNIPTEEGFLKGDVKWQYYGATGHLILSGEGDVSGVKKTNSNNEQYAFPLKDRLFLIKSVEFKEGITGDKTGYFRRSKSLESIKYAETMTSISSLSLIEKIKEVVIPNGVTKKLDCWGCTSLEKIFIPASMSEKGYDLFDRCDSLTDIYYGGSKEQWEEFMGTSLEKFKKEHGNVTIHYDYKY